MIEDWAWNRFDASAFYPSSGMSSDLNLIHFPGSYSGCLAINRKHPDKPKAESFTQELSPKEANLVLLIHEICFLSEAFLPQSQYCLLTLASEDLSPDDVIPETKFGNIWKYFSDIV